MTAKLKIISSQAKAEEKTYHIDLEWPLTQKTFQFSVMPSMSRHAADQADDRGIELSKKVLSQTFAMVEVTLDSNGKAVKSLVRGKSSVPGQELCLVVRKNVHGEYFIVTAWLNSATDLHASLNASAYAKVG